MARQLNYVTLNFWARLFRIILNVSFMESYSYERYMTCPKCGSSETLLSDDFYRRAINIASFWPYAKFHLSLLALIICVYFGIRSNPFLLVTRSCSSLLNRYKNSCDAGDENESVEFKAIICYTFLPQSFSVAITAVE
jgi:hypothetical protein